MSDEEKLSYTPSSSRSTPTEVPEGTETKKEDDEFEERLAGLPEKYREEILKQYDIPNIKVNLFHVLGHAEWTEVLLMIIGTFCSIAAGITPPFPPFLTCSL